LVLHTTLECITLKSSNSFDDIQAKKELIELKGYLDMGIVTQEEFDKKVESLKKILLGN